MKRFEVERRTAEARRLSQASSCFMIGQLFTSDDMDHWECGNMLGIWNFGPSRNDSPLYFNLF